MNNPMAQSNKVTLQGINVAYDGSRILRDVDFNIPENSVVSLLGRNGVGKTTTLKTIMGIAPASSGTITLDGNEIQGLSTEKRARSGIGYVPQGREIFSGLSVWENLKISMSIHGKDNGEKLDEVFSLFPVLKEMRNRKGGVLSGGQQQQLAIGRALLTNPKLLLLDEPTEGIQPSIIDQIEDAINYLKKNYDMSILLVEQYIDFAKACSDHFAIMERGTIVEAGKISALTDDVIAQYLTV
ncbi:urea ABC transporter ATP-binding subunit UrtE [Rubritalea marina]|uniref:urea ABC transporter ATP-binding subunit UrtE n=1 Tax=Rubritalea marina TaxID=361055 RepID=UPI0012EAEDCB|nr:urea ABC transporter ATP-binding subunit UrtE [Rubritalea marina]